MSANGWVSLIALSGWLILVIGALRTHRVGGRRMLVMALTWGAIFLFVTATVVAVSGAEQIGS